MSYTENKNFFELVKVLKEISKNIEKINENLDRINLTLDTTNNNIITVGISNEEALNRMSHNIEYAIDRNGGNN